MLVFFDESGYLHPNDPCKYAVSLAVCLKETDMRTITLQFYKLKDRLYGQQVEIKSTQLINPRIFRKQMTKHQEYAQSVIDILESVDSCIFAIVLENSGLCPPLQEDKLPIEYLYLLQRIQAYCDHNRTLMATCVFDETDDGRDKRRARSINNYLFRNLSGQTFDKILVSPFFVSSSVTPTIELPDICAGIVRVHFSLGLDKRQPQDEYETWVNELFRRIQRRTFSYKIRGADRSGIYVVNERELRLYYGC